MKYNSDLEPDWGLNRHEDSTHMTTKKKKKKKENYQDETLERSKNKRNCLTLNLTVYPPNSKWATPQQGTPPSFYRPRRGGRYNVGQILPFILYTVSYYTCAHVAHHRLALFHPGFTL